MIIEDMVARELEKINATTVEVNEVKESMPFVGLSEKLAESLVESAGTLFALAENKQRETEIFAQQLRAEIKKRAEELVSLRERIEQFGRTVLEAHKQFHQETEV